MKKKTVMKKTIKPSQRESITDFSASFGSGHAYEVRMRRRRIIITVSVILGIAALILLGFFVTETLIDITELPV